MSIRCRRPEHPGVVFRSMLELRWSAVFDELGLPWTFEPVRFDLPSGIYIPDFKIYPEPGDERTFWIEVKGPWPTAREFEVATEINIYAGVPLMILSGDVPRQANGGTAWFFDPHRDMWSMLRPEEALIRIMWPDPEDRPEVLAGWELALRDSRNAELIKVEG